MTTMPNAAAVHKLLAADKDLPVQPVIDFDPVEFISTGSLILDNAIGGGLPVGRITTIWGGEGYGKSTIALMCAKQTIADGDLIAYVDMEGTLNREWAKNYGIGEGMEQSPFFLFQPDCGEDALNLISLLLEKNLFRLIILDSAASLVTKAQLAGEIGDHIMTAQARILTQFLDQTVVHIRKSDTAFLIINQARDKIGGMPGGGNDIMPRGRALRFASSVIIKMLSKGDEHKKKGTTEVVAIDFRGQVKKNKVGPPWRKFAVKCYVDINAGADVWNELASVGKGLGIFTNANGDPNFKNGNWYFNGEKLANGEKAVTEYLKENQSLPVQVLTYVKVALNSGQLPVSEADDEIENIPEPLHVVKGIAA